MVTATKTKPNGNGSAMLNGIAENRMTMASLIKGKLILPPKTMLYGTDGIGKSTFGANANKPVFIATEEGALRIDVPKFQCESWSDMFGALITLGKESHDFKTLVIDSIDWAQALCVKHIITTEYAGNVQDFEAYGRGYKSVIQEFRKLLAFLDRLQKVKHMEIVLIAHATVKTFQNPTGDNYDRYQSNLIDSPATSIWGLIKEWCDIVLFANYQVMVRKANIKATKGKGALVGGEAGSRVCHSCPSAAWDAKVRAGWNLPKQFPLSYAEFSKYVHSEAAVVEEEEIEETETAEASAQ